MSTFKTVWTDMTNLPDQPVLLWIFLVDLVWTTTGV